MNIKQALIKANKKLNLKNSSLDAEVLLSFVLKKPKEFLYTHPETELTMTQEKKLKSLLNRRLKCEPVAYLTNHKEFYGLDFYVDKRVLVPRPETELLVEKLILSLRPFSFIQGRLEYAERRGLRPNVVSVGGRSNLIRLLHPDVVGVRNDKYTIADIGTGSGCIAIALAKHLPKAKVIATDVCQRALKVAQKNAKTHQVKIKFFQGDLLEPIKNQKIDIIVANLPYGAKEEWRDDNSIKFEPELALYSKKSGLAIYEKLFQQIKSLKLKPKLILIEIDPSQVNNIKKIIKQHIPQSKIKIEKDLAGLNRYVVMEHVTHNMKHA